MAASEVILVVVVSALLLRHAATQCVSNCGCVLFPTSCCLMVQENQPATAIGRDNSTSCMQQIGMFANPEFRFDTESFPNVNEVFAIDSASGVISTRRPFDRENETFTTSSVNSFMQNGYCVLLGLQVVGSSNTICTVNIKVTDANDNPPAFLQPENTIHIPETTRIGSAVTRVECTNQAIAMLTAEDPDDGNNATVSYSVDGSNLFMIPDPTVPCVINKPNVELDRDVPPTEYSFTLVAMDQGNPPLQTQTNVRYVLQDVNDNSPVFENSTYVITIRESLRPPLLVFQFRATDLDLGTNGGTDLTYTIDDQTGHFQVDPLTGNLTLIKSVDAESQNMYNLVVSATDMGGPPPLVGSASVVISVMDVNEMALITPDQRIFQINETEIYTTAIAFIAIADTDRSASNRNNTLRIVNGEDLFQITKLSFAYVLGQTRAVDYEQNSTLRILLETIEWGDPVLRQTVNISLTVLDVNDNAPSLSFSQFSFAEDQGGTRGNRLIVDLSQYVFDLDSGVNGAIGEYRLISVNNDTGELTSEFMGALDRNTGMLTTQNLNIVIDREVLGDTLSFAVNVTDEGEPSLSQVLNFTVTVLDLNDNLPVFEEPSYTFHLLENQPRATSFGTVTAMDPDYQENGTVFYSIEGESQFSITDRTGEIMSGAVFDREISDGYKIRLGARDNANPPKRAEMVSVIIVIDDENDEDPVFPEQKKTFMIDTNFRPGSLAAWVVARDADSALYNITVYRLESNSSFFSIRDNSSGNITLVESLSNERVFVLNISAFNPGREERKDTITITITVTVAKAPFAVAIIAGAAGGTAFLLILIVVVAVLLLCTCYKNRKYKDRYDIKEADLNNINAQSSILKIPATNGQQPRSRVTFKESVQETHYHEQSVVNDTDNTIMKESITKFDNLPRANHLYTSDDEGEEEDGGDISLGHDHHGLPEDMTVTELEMSPGHMVNGDIPTHHHSYNIRPGPHSPIIRPRPHSPIIRVVNGGGPAGGEVEVEEFSQGTSSDGHTYMDDEESMFSDDASIVNTSLSRYGNKHLDTQYGTPSTHSHHLELHHHLPPMSHGQPTNTSLAQLHAHNLAQLAEAKRQQQQQQQQHYSSLHSNTTPIATSEHEHSSLTLTSHNHHIQHSNLSADYTHPPPSTHHIHSHLGNSSHSHVGASTHPHVGGSSHSHMGASTHPHVGGSSHSHMGGSSSKHLHSGGGGGTGRNYPHPLVMPDAFPRDTTDIHRFPIGSYADDYGDESTYASTELDEALGFNLEAEPGIISLTATTDYEDTVL